MKFLASILVIILLAMSCVPCSDAECAVIQKIHSETTIKIDAGHSTSSHQGHSDLCSPFCQCSCCAIAYALPTAIVPEVERRAIISDKVFASYLQQWPVGIALPVWQPPQLV